MDNQSEEERQQQKRADLQALDRLAVQFVTEALTDVMNKGECDVIADVSVNVKVQLKLTKKSPDVK